MSHPEIVLHLGAHKTATTSVQHWCNARTADLAREGFVYIGHTQKEISTYRIIRTACAVARQERQVQGLDARITLLRDSLRSKLENPSIRAILIPWEIFLGEPYDPDVPQLYPGADASVAMLARIFDGFPLHVVYTLRDQFGFLNSWFQQMQKLGQSVDPQAYRNWAATADLGWQPVVGKLKAGLGTARLTVLAYQKTGMLDLLLSAYGLPPGLAKGSDKVVMNKGWPKGAMQVAALAMPHLTAPDRARLRALLDDLVADHTAEPFQVLDPSLKAGLLARYRADLAALLPKSD